MKTRLLIVLLALVATTVPNIQPACAHPSDAACQGKDAQSALPASFPTDAGPSGHFTARCRAGMAGAFPCDQVDLQSFLPMSAIGGGRGSDVWGWTDDESGRRWAIAGRSNGTAFVDITRPHRPVYVANLPTSGTQEVIWRDIKVHADHAYIVSESAGHGMQVVDLRQLRDIPLSAAPVELTETSRYLEFGRAHNIAVNTDTGYAYAVGAREDVRSCAGGLHMIDLSAPAAPVFGGCEAADGYVHDTQCVVYEGPDVEYRGQEICANSNEDTLTIVDATDKADVVELSRTPYEGSAYTHQGWFTEDQRHFLVGDELDELSFAGQTRTYIWDLADLDDARLIGTYQGETPSTDHNIYVKGRYAYESNYRAGLRILDLGDVAEGELTEAGFIDVYPPDDDPGFSHGTWSNYPYYDNGVVAVNGYEGLFIVRPRLPR